jgi:hypothetical protein
MPTVDLPIMVLQLTQTVVATAPIRAPAVRRFFSKVNSLVLCWVIRLTVRAHYMNAAQR